MRKMMYLLREEEIFVRLARFARASEAFISAGALQTVFAML